MASCLRLVSTNSRPSSVLRLRLGTRSIHKRIPLPYPISGGLGKFLPPAALQTLVEYQDGLLSRLNEEVRADTKLENHSNVLTTVLKYASLRKRTLAFNYGVLALNNSFFLNQLSPPQYGKDGNHNSKISVLLAEKIRTQYGDLPRLKSTFSATALGMFSNGWVWFVVDTAGELGVLPTLGPSTLLIRSRDNMNYIRGLILGEDDLKVQTPSSLPQPAFSPLSKTPPPSNMIPSSSGGGPGSQTSVPPLYRSIHSSPDYENPTPSEEAVARGPGPGPQNVAGPQNVGDMMYPLFCLPVYEHAWMSAGFGVWGKEEWLKEFWTVLDWGKVSKAFEHAQMNITVRL